MTPVPVSEKAQETTPLYVAVPVTVSGTVVPTSCPDADPVTAMFPAHVAEKLPDIELAAALVACQRKLLQDPGAGTVIESDTQIPSYGGPGVGVGVGVDGVGVGA